MDYVPENISLMSKTALLFFSRSPVAETDHKVIYPGDKRKNRAIIDLLYENSLKNAARSGLDVILFDESQQRGNSFGERFANAFQQLFSEGYDQIISIGNDCPAIGEVQWKSICEFLEKGKMVVGPTPVGGAYLIAMTAEQFEYKPFRELPWQSSRLLQQLTHYFQSQAFSLQLLRYRTDINRYGDAQAFLKSPAASVNKRFRQLLSQIIKTDRNSEFFIPVLFNGYNSSTPSRAPPVS